MSRRLNFWALALLLIALIAGAYLPNVNGAYHFDDGHTVSENPAMRNWNSLVDVWTDSRLESLLPANRSYRPLLFVTYFLCYQAGDGETWVFHVVKMLMHLVFCMASFVIWRRLFALFGWIPASMPRWLTPDALAAYLAVLLAIHPASNECVNYITATSTLQCATFYVLGFCAYLIGREKGTITPMVLAMLCYVASVLTKEEGITLPAVLVVYELMCGRRRLLATAPFWVAFLALAFLQYKMLPETHAESRGSVSSMNYFMTQWRAYLWYMKLWFWPFDLNADNVSFGFSSGFTDIRVIQAVIGNGLICVLAWINRKRVPAFLFGMLWFYIAISPASSIMPLAEPVNERRMFLSYVGYAGGLLPVVIPGLMQIARLDGRKLVAAMVAIVLCLFGGAVRRSLVWNDAESLWEDTLEKNPESGRALNNLALVYMRTAKMDKALELLGRCETVWTGYAYCSINKAITLVALKRYPEAKTSFERAIGLNPRLPDSHFYYADFLEKMGDVTTARASFLKVDELAGGVHIEAKLRSAQLAIKANEPAQARALLEDALRVAPNEERIRTLYETVKP